MSAGGRAPQRLDTLQPSMRVRRGVDVTGTPALAPESAHLLRRLLADGWNNPDAMGMDAARTLSARQAAALAGSPPPVAEVLDRVAPGPAGDVPIRTYRPATASIAGLLVWLHGGGFTFGSLDQSDVLARALAAASSCVVVSVGYRLAPEHPFPAGLEDCYAAVSWVATHADQLSGSADRLAVGGDSSGGCLAAGVTLLARNRRGPRIDQQVLVYPVTSCRWQTGVSTSALEVPFPSVEALAWHMKLYLGAVEPTAETASPLLADSLAHLPPALIVTAGYDTLREEAERYADRLRAAGVRVDMRRYDGALHGFLDFGGVPGLADVAARAIEDIGQECAAPSRTTQPRATRASRDDARR